MTEAQAGRWYGAVATALAGVELPEPSGGALDAESIVRWLGDQGWPAERLAEHRAGCRESGEPWPHPVPAGWLPPGSAARFHALLTAVQDAAGVRGLVARQVPAERHIGPAERRLLGDVPPHHGSF